MSDRIILRGAEFFARHGVRAAEREVGNRFVVDVALETDTRAAAAQDDLAKTISYADVYRVVRDLVQNESHQLLETLAERLAAELLARFPTAGVQVRVLKRSPPLDGIVDSAGVEIHRSRNA